MVITSPSLTNFGKKGHRPIDFGLFFSRVIFHDCYLNIRTSLFERGDEHDEAREDASDPGTGASQVAPGGPVLLGAQLPLTAP